MKRHTIDSLLALVQPDRGSACILYSGHIDKNGYGVLTVKRKRFRVHRLIYEHFNGPIPPGLVPDHLCRVRCCINPEHMEAVTQPVNVLRGISMTAINAKKQECIYGHHFTPDNTIVRTRADGRLRRECRTCKIAARNKWNKKLSESRKAKQ